MANAISTSITGYHQEEVQKYFLSPLFLGDDSYLSKFTIYPDVKSSMKLDHFQSAEYITNANAGAAFSADAETSSYTQKTLVVGNLEAEMEQRANVFFATVKAQALKLGTAKDNIDGTVIKEIMANIMMQAVKRDFHRQLWFANLNNSAAGSDTDGTGRNADYDVYDGIFEVLKDGLGAGQKLTIGVAGDSPSTGCTLAASGVYTGAEVISILEAVVDAATPELTELPKTMYVSGVIANAYMKYLRSQNISESFIYLQDGTPANLSFAGIPMVVRRDWDSHIANDFSLITDASAADSTGRIALIADGAIAVGSDFQGASVENWYSLDQKAYRMRFGYACGTQLMDSKLAVTALHK
tara:strand:- start:739 stop:1803 length:1065 start_codon:yes stop_codon:yes gene_type:complete